MKNKILNLGIMAHVDAGKTTVTESILYHSGIIKHMGNVDKGTTITDSLELEQKRGMTIKSSTVSFYIDDVKINLIDTPGHMDFIGEVERSLAVLDGVILVISAKEGVQPQTRIIFHELNKMKLPVIFFINKVDRLGVNIDKVYKDIKNQLTDKCLIMQKVNDYGTKQCTIYNYSYSDEPFTEQIILASEKLLHKYLNDISILDEDYSNSIRFKVQNSKIYPIYHGSALMDIGVDTLITAIAKWFVKDNHTVNNHSNLSAYVYKIQWDSNHHKKAYVKIFSGELKVREKVLLCRTGESITMKNMFSLYNGKEPSTQYICQNDIGILYDVEELNCGDFIGNTLKFNGLMNMAEPLLSVGIRPSDPSMRSNLLGALNELMVEDPFLSLDIKKSTGEITLKLFGKLQKEILQSILKERYEIDAYFEEIRTVSKEKPMKKVTYGIGLNDQGNPYRAGIWLTLEPLPIGSDFIYESQVSLGYIEKSFQTAVEHGVILGIKEGIHNEVVDVKVTFVDADYDSVTSTPSDYRKLAPEVIKKALQICGVKNLEPYMKYILITPMGYEKIVMCALNSMKASIETIDYSNMELNVKGVVPYDLCKDFQLDLLSMTEGTGVFETEFLEYRDIL